MSLLLLAREVRSSMSMPRDGKSDTVTPPRPCTVLFAVAFRPFFLLAAVWAMLAMLRWLSSVTGWGALPQLTPGWHAHELLFGVVAAAAAAAGFALTAVATWTGVPPLAVMGLMALVLLWIAGRLLMLADGHSERLVTLALSLGESDLRQVALLLSGPPQDWRKQLRKRSREGCRRIRRGRRRSMSSMQRLTRAPSAPRFFVAADRAGPWR